MIYQGLTVLDIEPNRRVTPTPLYRRDKTRIGTPTSRFTEIDRGGQPNVSRRFSWLLDGWEEIEAARVFFAERKGRLVPFWVPTWHHDLRMTVARIAADADLVVQSNGYTRYQFGGTTSHGRKHLALIRVGAGIQTTRRIIAAVEGSGTETLTLDGAVGFEAHPDHTMVSFLTIVRLASDTVPFHWHGPKLAEVDFEVFEVPDEAP